MDMPKRVSAAGQNVASTRMPTPMESDFSSERSNLAEQCFAFGLESQGNPAILPVVQRSDYVFRGSEPLSQEITAPFEIASNRAQRGHNVSVTGNAT